MELGENIRKLLLAGIGSAAMTAEKSKEILDDLVKKGELPWSRERFSIRSCATIFAKK